VPSLSHSNRRRARSASFVVLELLELLELDAELAPVVEPVAEVVVRLAGCVVRFVLMLAVGMEALRACDSPLVVALPTVVFVVLTSSSAWLPLRKGSSKMVKYLAKPYSKMVVST
jgi:hypothetical protein